MNFKFSKLSKDVKAPEKFDGYYKLFTSEDTTVDPISTKLLNTGIKLEFPSKYYAQISGVKGKVRMMSGVIDSDYRGELKIMVFNGSSEPAIFRKNESYVNMHFIEIADKSEVVIE